MADTMKNLLYLILIMATNIALIPSLGCNSGSLMPLDPDPPLPADPRFEGIFTSSHPLCGSTGIYECETTFTVYHSAERDSTDTLINGSITLSARQTGRDALHPWEMLRFEGHVSELGTSEGTLHIAHPLPEGGSTRQEDECEATVRLIAADDDCPAQLQLTCTEYSQDYTANRTTSCRP